jgi:hypothetical protein
MTKNILNAVGWIRIISVEQSHNRSVGRDGVQNWPPLSLHLHPSEFRVFGYIKATVYAHKVKKREGIIQRILSDKRRINDAAVLHKVTRSHVTCVRKFIQADGGHFEHLA